GGRRPLLRRRVHFLHDQRGLAQQRRPPSSREPRTFREDADRAVAIPIQADQILPLLQKRLLVLERSQLIVIEIKEECVVVHVSTASECLCDWNWNNAIARIRVFIIYSPTIVKGKWGFTNIDFGSLSPCCQQ